MFTFKEMARMFMDAGYSVENVIMRKNPINEEHEKLLDNIMAMVHESERWMFEAFQFVISRRCWHSDICFSPSSM